MTAVFLHLSDIHIKNKDDFVLGRAASVAQAVFSYLPSATHLFVIVSGDIAFSGGCEQYSLALDFFINIQHLIKEESSVPIDFIIVPGNHDCNFKLSSEMREIVIEDLEKRDFVGRKIDDSLIETCTSVQKDFFSFRELIDGQEESKDSRLWKTRRFLVENKVVEFDCLNIAWVSKLSEDPGKLLFPIHLYSNKTNEGVDLRCVVMHHPLNWFSQSVYRQFRIAVRGLANILITGHEHQGNVGVIAEAESGSSAFIEGCVLQGNSSMDESSFNIVVIDFDASQFLTIMYQWEKNKYIAKDGGAWSAYHDLPVKKSNPFSINIEFQQYLDDPGAYFTHPGKNNVVLSDIFIYPDLMKINNNSGGQREIINSYGLLDPAVTADGVLIEGEEKSGCTSLLIQLYIEYHNRGYVPIFIKGDDVNGYSDRDINQLIRKKIEKQYSQDQIVNFEQLPKGRKILLFDDFDRVSSKSTDLRAKLLRYLRKCFGHIVVSVGEFFEIKEIVNGDNMIALRTMKRYKLQPFGYVLRSKLISKWHSMGLDVRYGDGRIIEECDQSEKLIDSVMQKGIIPSVPFYLITLLQGIDAGRSGDFKNSGLGYYYQYILTEAFQYAGVRTEKLTEYFHYASCLAWAFHQKGQRELSIYDIRLFNEKFSNNWHTVDLCKRLKELVDAKIICKSGDDYYFRYPYIYYFLKGKYISGNLHEIEIQDYVRRCCQHLYVRDHANTVLFLAHHTNDDFVLESIVVALRGVFENREPITFDEEISVVNGLIENVPKLVYSGGNPDVHRERRNILADQIDDGTDGLIDVEENGEKLSLVAKIVMLHKTTEILGQVLKNQYATIKRVRKGELIKELFDGPLRAIQDFYEFFESNPDALVAEIDGVIRRKGKMVNEDERKGLAKKIAATLIQLITYSFIMRAAQNANSESLYEDVSVVVNKVGSPAFKLIELGIVLDSAKPIPRSKIKSLQQTLSGNIVAERIVNLMVLNRLYMFKTSEQDMQWINGVLDLNMKAQHSITYQERRTKKIK